MNIAEQFGQELFEALRDRRTLQPLIERAPTLTIDDAYAISRDFLSRRRKDGERVIGKKIGVTSKAVQDMLDVHQPDFGFLTDAMHIRGDAIDIDAVGLIQPRAEAEIAFILAAPLKGPGVTADDVIAATECIAPCFEIVDSRISDWKVGIVDTVADNASCGVFVIGKGRLNPRDLDLPNLHVAVVKNGTQVSDGYAYAVQGNPAEAVAWLANTLGARGVALEAGDIILSGSIVPLEPAARGDIFEMILGYSHRTLGHCVARFL